ncbi:MAG TPA: DNA repair protein RecN [Thermodesulfobacteriota bacterium]|jgi:DNA repair protein RecN (Recombination protein N)|nr:DNA repair protein RecN [Thermodesulfobacteriota bacterium]
MLLELRIKNFAIIDELDLSFSKGFNILTGETGAGKSIILNAVQLLLGDRASEELIRSSEEEASVEALFDISENREVKGRIHEKGQRLSGAEEGDSLLVRRVISRSGRGKAFINGNLATLGMLSEIGEELLSIYGQHEHQSLQRVDTHIDILDEFGELMELRDEFQNLFQRFTSLSQELERIRGEKERREKERELRAFQSKEIEKAGIRIGEEEALKEEKRVLTHAKKLTDFANASEEVLYSTEGSAIERIQSVLHQGKEMATIDPSLSPIFKNLDGALIQLEEVALALRDYSKRIEVNPGRLEEIENRLEEIDRLKRKYGSTEADILRFKEEVDETLSTFTSDEERLSRLEGEIGPLREEMTQRAQKLSRERKRVASELKRSVEKELATLGMKKTTFQVRIDDQALSHRGQDRIEFLISANIGEEVKPLAKIASGGELSRIMLAMKRILAIIGGRQVLIFDEVDAGIGGAIAEVVGRKLRELSKHHQVICVTHLPQIACFADRHHSVKKEVKSGRTVTVVDPLEKEARVDEIARMLGGVKVTEKTRAHAQEMMENAKK